VLVAHFDMNDLQMLAQDVGAMWDALRGDTLVIKAISLVQWAEQRAQLDVLVAAVVKARPAIDWRLSA
jgi:hypothetical protein